jgi:hypothetical protein
LPPEIREAVNKVFQNNGYPLPCVRHRTCQKDFMESPHNFLPSQRHERDRRGWTVFLFFSFPPPSFDNLLEIIAFEDSRETEFPLLERVRLGDKLKADFDRLPGGVRFNTLGDLEYVT